MKGRTKKYSKGDLAYIEKEPKFTTTQLIEALFNVEDLLNGAMCPFVLLDETARQVMHESKNINPHIELNEISVGAIEKNIAQSVREMIRTLRPEAEWLDNTISYEFKGIPITIWRIKKNLDVFERPDKIFFYTTEFYIPNPFRKYWNERDLIA